MVFGFLGSWLGVWDRERERLSKSERIRQGKAFGDELDTKSLVCRIQLPWIILYLLSNGICTVGCFHRRRFIFFSFNYE